MDENLCPDCGGKMVSRKNTATGQCFWGCKQFPMCRGVRDTDGNVRTRQTVQRGSEGDMPSDRQHGNDRGRWKHQ